jgi:hypothetical protein
MLFAAKFLVVPLLDRIVFTGAAVRRNVSELPS